MNRGNETKQHNSRLVPQQTAVRTMRINNHSIVRIEIKQSPKSIVLTQPDNSMGCFKKTSSKLVGYLV